MDIKFFGQERVLAQIIADRDKIIEELGAEIVRLREEAKQKEKPEEKAKP